jgi:hypothetical protein
MSCNFPVCPSSPPSCILAAFQQSGYFSQLNPQQQAAAQSDPAGWLNAHPYLYDAYPQYFNATCGAPIVPGKPPDYLLSGNPDYLIQQNAVQTAAQINQGGQSWWDQFLKNLEWFLIGGPLSGSPLPPSLEQSLNQQQNAPPQGSPNNPPPSPQIPPGYYPNTGGQRPEWLLPFEDFGNWLLSVGKGINDFLNTLGSVYSEAVTVSGEHPLGVVMLIVFFLALVAIFIFLPKL